jgi:phage tail tube protein FII
LKALRTGSRPAHNKRGASDVNAPLKDEQLLTIVKNVVEQNGCRLIEIDFENHILNIEGSDEAQARCALALEEVLG